LTAADILAKARQWGLKGAQVGLGEMPPLNTREFDSLRGAIQESGFFWEVSAGMVQREDGVRQAIEYNAALGTTVVRAFMEGFGIQFKGMSLDDYVTDAIAHIKNLLPEFGRRGLRLCLENHGGLRMKHIRRVLETFPTEHLGLCLDTGNPILVLEDPTAVIQELAPRTYTCHLKDWNLVRIPEGVAVLGCALGDGIVDLPAAVETLKTRALFPEDLHLNIEAPQEYIPLKLFTAEFWRHCPDITGAELGHVLGLAEKRNMPAGRDYRIASMRGEPERTILAEEEAAVAQSVRYCRETLRLI
jgi:sugar phosphate isomerase/epimerase